jgi:hypothetical protein
LALLEGSIVDFRLAERLSSEADALEKAFFMNEFLLLAVIMVYIAIRC